MSRLMIVGLILGQPALKSAASITNALTAHLRFNGNFSDSTSNHIDGVPMALGTNDTTNPAFETGFLGQAVHILVTPDGATNRYVSLQYPPLLHFGSDATGDTTDFSFSMWVKVFGHTADEPFISNMNWDSSGDLGWVVASEADGLRISLRDDVNSHKDMNGHAAAAVVDGNWHNLVLTFQRTGVANTYLDGVLDVAHVVNIAPDPGNGVGSLDTDGLPVTRGPGWAVNLGEDGTGLYGISDNAGIDCLLDDVGVWRRALTADEVAQIYGAGLQGLDIEQSVNAGAFFKAPNPPPLNLTDTGIGNASAVGVVSIQIVAGAHPVNASSIHMILDGQPVAATNSLSGGLTTVSYAYGTPQPLPSLSTHTVTVWVSDTATPPLFVTNSWTFAVGRYTIVPAAYASPTGSANTPGMLFRSVWAKNATPALAADLTVAEEQLDGTLIDPSTGQPFGNDATAGSLKYFGVSGYYPISVVNFEEHGTNAGDILGDTGFPGMPVAAPGGENDSFSTEAIAFIDLQPGYYHWGVYSDDGFAVEVGNPPQSLISSTKLAQNSGPSRTTFDFQIVQAGVYQFRLIYQQSSSAASEEWWSADPFTGVETLINGTNSTVKTYQVLTNVAQSPYVRDASPAPGEINVLPTPLISVDVVDGSSLLVPASISMSLNGSAVSGFSLNKSGNVTTVSYQVPTGTPLALASTDTVSLAYSDGALTRTNVWSFAVHPALTVGLVCHLPFDSDYKDTSGNGVDGTPLALGTALPALAPALQAGQIGNAVHMTATSDNQTNAYVTLLYPPQLRMGSDLTHDTSDFSISFWVQVFSSSADEPFISNFNWDSSNDSGWIISNEGSGMRVDLHDRGGSAKRDTGTFSTATGDGSWHHVAVTFQRTGAALIYVDGNLVNTLNIAPDPGFLVGSLDTYDLNPGRGPGTFAWNLGQDGTGEYAVSDNAAIDFLMDDLGIWRRALAVDEVTNIYQLGLSGKTFAAPISNPSSIKLSSTLLSGNKLQFSWSGGNPPYILQMKTNLTDLSWTAVQTNASLTATQSMTGLRGFFRVLGH